MSSSWYYASGGRQMGPVSEAELDNLVYAGTLRPDTLVWHQGLANWTAYSAARPGHSTPLAVPPASNAVLPHEHINGADAALSSAGPDPHPGEPTRFCTQCGRPAPERELAQFGDQAVCVHCKAAFVHTMRERGYAGRRFAYAGFWIRLVAKVLDGILMYIVLLPVTFLLLGPQAIDPTPQIDAKFVLTQFAVLAFQVLFAAAYEVWFIVNHSATPGKMAIGKRVIMADGARLTYGRAIARHLSTYISSFTLGIGYIIAAFDDEKRALHDRICDTRVVAK